MEGSHLLEGQTYCQRPKEMEVLDRQRQSARHLTRQTINNIPVFRIPSSAEISVVTMYDDEVFDCREGLCKSTEAPSLWPLGDV